MLFTGPKKSLGVPMDRFEAVGYDIHQFGSHSIYKDKMTGVLYYVISSGNGIALTTLVDKNGKPIVVE